MSSNNNALTTTTPGGRYVSIFENPAEFGAKIQIATALAKTQFVPETFRNKPEDCLVALDMAGRLDLNPLAVFSDIYIIDNRASFSSKFLIALVNRSGRFTRIQFDEGVDGVADVTFSGWGEQRGQRKTWKEKVPNYYATASFTEIASGEVFTSPRVDLNFAEKNGWVAKSGSKWQTMPQIMCRYRAASILIKSVCPEIVMGLEWSDDLLDAREEKPTPAPRRVDVAPASANPPRPAIKNEMVVEIIDDDAFQSFGLQIHNATTLAELNTIAAAIADGNFTDAQKKALRRVWLDRKRELQTLPPAEGLPSENVVNTVALASRIQESENADALESMRSAVDDARENGQINDDDRDSLFNAISRRLDDLSKADDEPPLPTPTQIENEKRRRETIETLAKEGNLNELNFLRAAVFDDQITGALTPDQSQNLTAEIIKAVEALEP